MAKEYEENYEENFEEEAIIEDGKAHPILDFIRKHPKGCAIAAAFIGTVLGGLLGVEIGKNCFEVIEDGELIEGDSTDVTDNGEDVQVTEF